MCKQINITGLYMYSIRLCVPSLVTYSDVQSAHPLGAALYTTAVSPAHNTQAFYSRVIPNTLMLQALHHLQQMDTK